MHGQPISCQDSVSESVALRVYDVFQANLDKAITDGCKRKEKNVNYVNHESMFSLGCGWYVF